MRHIVDLFYFQGFCGYHLWVNISGIDYTVRTRRPGVLPSIKTWRLRSFGSQGSQASSFPHCIRQGALDPWRCLPLQSAIRYCVLSRLFSICYLNTVRSPINVT